MKKQFLNLGKALNKAEQRSVNGGVMDDLDSESGTCGYQTPSGCFGGVSKAVAKRLSASYGGHWCCESCATVSWGPC